MSLALPVLIGLVIGSVSLSLFGWWPTVAIAGVLLVVELVHDVRQYREPWHG